jgi:DNA-binding response OmpR family regulator
MAVSQIGDLRVQMSGYLSELTTTGLVLPRPCSAHVEMMGAAGALEGKRVFVVEDEMLLALDLEEGLQDAGCKVVGPAGSLRTALRIAGSETFDIAILDVNLAGERVFPVAHILRERGIPFAFATAYAGADDLYPADVKSAPRLAKPFTISQAIALLRTLAS